MEIEFKDAKLEEQVKDLKSLICALGPQRAKILLHRLADLKRVSGIHY